MKDAVFQFTTVQSKIGPYKKFVCQKFEKMEITAGQQRVFTVQAPALVDFRNQGAIQRLEDITRQVGEQTINRTAENRVRPQPQENNE